MFHGKLLTKFENYGSGLYPEGGCGRETRIKQHLLYKHLNLCTKRENKLHELGLRPSSRVTYKQIVTLEVGVIKCIEV
jgi:hypothetical protein